LTAQGKVVVNGLMPGIALTPPPNDGKLDWRLSCRGRASSRRIEFESTDFL
jgi:hypothetical protein